MPLPPDTNTGITERQASRIRDIQLTTIEKNPGPPVKCPTCKKIIKDRSEYSVWCAFGGWVHLRCTRLKSTAEYREGFECELCSWCQGRWGVTSGREGVLASVAAPQSQPDRTQIGEGGRIWEGGEGVLATVAAPLAQPGGNRSSGREGVLASVAAPLAQPEGGEGRVRGPHLGERGFWP